MAEQLGLANAEMHRIAWDGVINLNEFISVVGQVMGHREFLIANVASGCDCLEDFRMVSEKVSRSLGELMEQNEAGESVIEVYDRNHGRIEEGARYHQTRQGGDIHTDSVNRPEPMRYLALACAAHAMVGGESIIIRAHDIYKALRPFPDVITCLSQDFYFERRGIDAEQTLFKMPVLTVEDGKAKFRYLRSYIASAHERAQEPLNAEQVAAFDMLDCLLEMSIYQTRLILRPGDILIAEDTATFHGRTSFVDGPVPGAYYDRRMMLRYWMT